MFRYRTAIYLEDTDATGVLYFSSQFKIALKVFEEFLKSKNLSLKTFLQQKHYLMPIVHAEGNYFAPLQVGDEIEVVLTVIKINNSSFHVSYQFHDLAKNLIGTVTLVHVTMAKESKQSIPIPEELRSILTEPIPSNACGCV